MTTEIDIARLGTLPPELYAQQQQLNRQQQLANMLMQQNQQPQGQMVSGRYVAPSFFQNLQPVANMLAGAYLAKQGDTKAAELAQKLREGRATTEESIISKMTGTPAIQGQAEFIPQGQTLRDDNGMLTYGAQQAIEAKPATAPDYAAALREIRTNPYGAGKEFTPTILKQMLPDETELQKNYKTYQKDGGKLNFTDWVDRKDNERIALERQRIALDEKRLGLEFANQNKPQIIETANGFVAVNPRNPSQVVPVTIEGKPLIGKNALTESQGKAAVFHSQMVGANNELNNIYSKGFNPESKSAQLATGAAGGIFNVFTPAKAQQAKQAQNQWTEAYLRFKTGAGTNAHEIENNRVTFFPQYGDSPDVIAQKARMRQQAEKDIAIAAGSGGNLGAQPMPVPTPSTPNVSNNPQPQKGWGKVQVEQ